MAPYIQNYIDCLTGKVITDEGNKAHFKKALQVEVYKLEPLILECKSKGINPYTLCPELMKDYTLMKRAIAYDEVTWSKSTLEALSIIL